MTRPERMRITDELGLLKSVPADKGQFELHGCPPAKGARPLLLGLGPEPDKLADWFELPSDHVLYVECPEFEKQASPAWAESIPAQFTRLSPEEVTPALLASSCVIRYRPNLRLFPGFWAPLAARLSVALHPPLVRRKSVWLPTRPGDLLGRELSLAFEQAGYAVASPNPEKLERSPGTELAPLLSVTVPALFLSVNFKGLEPWGLGYNLLREAGAEVGIWLVDNPFHLLSSVKSPYWKEAHLFVTDSTFIKPLRDMGARSVHHLPLAASPDLFGAPGQLPDAAQGIGDRLVFVGRSEFPKKEQYFAGLSPDEALLDQAVTMLEHGERPDYHWWSANVPVDRKWPGNAQRKVGVGAEVASFVWKARCLAASGPDTVIFGDDRWARTDGITAQVRPLLDYYAHLPAVYRTARANLNITGMQLPAGLTQRHFDVWCAGGFLLTDANPGLDIFPDELTKPITFTTPAEIPVLFAHHAEDTPKRRELQRKWQALILRDHTYANRVTAIFQAIPEKS